MPEAEAAYRAALARASPAAAAALVSVRANLAVLLLNAGRLDDCITELDAALASAAALGLPAAQAAGMRFNRGKALAAAGRLAEADGAYLEAARAAAGSDLSVYGKALAAMEELPPAEAAAAAQVRAQPLALCLAVRAVLLEALGRAPAAAG